MAAGIPTDPRPALLRAADEADWFLRFTWECDRLLSLFD